jgi:hypothetical protein
MSTQLNSNINIPQSPFLDPTTGKPSLPWMLWLQSPNFIQTTTGQQTINGNDLINGNLTALGGISGGKF